MQQSNLSQLNNNLPIHNNFLYSIKLDQNLNCISPNTPYKTEISESFCQSNFSWENFSNELEFE